MVRNYHLCYTISGVEMEIDFIVVFDIACRGSLVGLVKKSRESLNATSTMTKSATYALAA